MDIRQTADSYIARLSSALERLDRGEVERFIALLLEAYEREAHIFVIGNGGSAATAGHFACDLNKGVTHGMKKRFRAVALADSQASLMAYANDTCYEDVFIEPLRNFLRPGDLVVALSGSGNSKNVLRAVEYANENGGVTVGLTGYDGGELRRIAQHSVNARTDDMQVSEDIHLAVTHIAMQAAIAALKCQR